MARLPAFAQILGITVGSDIDATLEGNVIRHTGGACILLITRPDLAGATNAIHYEFFTGRIERNRIFSVVQTCVLSNLRALPGAIWVGAIRPFSGSAAPVVRFNDIEGNAQAGLRVAPNITESGVRDAEWLGRRRNRGTGRGAPHRTRLNCRVNFTVSPRRSGPVGARVR